MHQEIQKLFTADSPQTNQGEHHIKSIIRIAEASNQNKILSIISDSSWFKAVGKETTVVLNYNLSTF
jgi:hypothetical protein